jgi:hypothetical protein
VNDLAATVNELALTVNELAAKVVVDAARFNNDIHLRVNVLETVANLRGPPWEGKATLRAPFGRAQLRRPLCSSQGSRQR